MNHTYNRYSLAGLKLSQLAFARSSTKTVKWMMMTASCITLVIGPILQNCCVDTSDVEPALTVPSGTFNGIYPFLPLDLQYPLKC